MPLILTLSGHVCPALPALLKTTLDNFTASAMPAPLRHILELVKQLFGAAFFMVVRQPDFWQALIWRQFTRQTTQKIALYAGRKARLLQGVSPQRSDGNIRSTG